MVTSPRRQSPVTTHRNDPTYGDLCRPRVRTMGLGSRESVSPGCPSGSRFCQGGLHADRTQTERSALVQSGDPTQRLAQATDSGFCSTG